MENRAIRALFLAVVAGLSDWIGDTFRDIATIGVI